MNIIKEFLRYRKVMAEVNTSSITKEDKLQLSAFSRELEKRIDEIVITKLIEMNFKGEVSRDYLVGFRDALLIRLGLIRDYSEPTDE